MNASPKHSHPRVAIEHAYAALIRDARRKPFQVGVHDCVAFAAASIKARTGRDVLAELDLDPTWRTEAEATAAIEALGGLRAALTRLFGEPVGILQARLGDVALVVDPSRPGQEAVALVHAGMLLAPHARGLGSLPLKSALAAWNVR